jgi:hypothetical protein
MKKVVTLILIASIWILQGCYFGAGVVEQNLPDDFFLFANNSLDENSIWYKTGEHSSAIIVGETVFAVGYNEDFIIAKRHPKDSINQVNKKITSYHIIEIDKMSKRNPEKSIDLTKEQYSSMRKRLKLPDSLKFETVFKEIE